MKYIFFLFLLSGCLESPNETAQNCSLLIPGNAPCEVCFNGVKYYEFHSYGGSSVYSPKMIGDRFSGAKVEKCNR